MIAAGLLIVGAAFCQTAMGQNKADLMVAAAYEGNLRRVQELLDQGVDINAKNKDGVTALWKTALSASHSRKSSQMAEFLLDKGADPNFKDEYGRTALMWASWHGPVELVRLLLDKGADADDGESLFCAVFYAMLNEHNLEVMKLLLDRGAKVNKETKYGMTALMNAAQYNETDVVNLLLDNGARINDTFRGATALITSICRGHMETVKLLLEKGADVNIKYYGYWNGRTALMEASASDHQIEEAQNRLWYRLRRFVRSALYCWPRYPPRKNDPEIVKLLLEHGADVNAKDKDGWTALRRAEKRGSKEIVESLKAHGAKE
jgi:ankyrin repeat protein